MSANLSHYDEASLSHSVLKIRKPIEIDILFKALGFHSGEPN